MINYETEITKYKFEVEFGYTVNILTLKLSDTEHVLRYFNDDEDVRNVAKKLVMHVESTRKR